MSNVNLRDMAGGLLVAGGGAAFAIQAWQYPMGQPGTLGPGAFPFGVGMIAVVLGLVLCFSAVLRGAPAHLPVGPRAVAAVLAAIAVFGILIQRVGLVPTVFFVTIIAALGSRETRAFKALGLALFMAVACWLVFVEGLGMSMPALRNPL